MENKKKREEMKKQVERKKGNMERSKDHSQFGTTEVSIFQASAGHQVTQQGYAKITSLCSLLPVLALVHLPLGQVLQV